tara:strand:- start:1640 stop:1756 length:117 start_codon:yes stop_codon:yes gene_type:complete
MSIETFETEHFVLRIQQSKDFFFKNGKNRLIFKETTNI